MYLWYSLYLIDSRLVTNIDKWPMTCLAGLKRFAHSFCWKMKTKWMVKVLLEAQGMKYLNEFSKFWPRCQFSPGKLFPTLANWGQTNGNGWISDVIYDDWWPSLILDEVRLYVWDCSTWTMPVPVRSWRQNQKSVQLTNGTISLASNTHMKIQLALDASNNVDGFG